MKWMPQLWWNRNGTHLKIVCERLQEEFYQNSKKKQWVTEEILKLNEQRKTQKGKSTYKEKWLNEQLRKLKNWISSITIENYIIELIS